MSKMVLSLLYMSVFLATAEAEARIDLLEMNATYSCSREYLVPQRDYFFAKFQVSGNDSDFTFEFSDEPSFEYTLINGSVSIHCSLIDHPVTGFCNNLAVYSNNKCSCEEEKQDVYIVSVNLTITSVRFSEILFNVRWPDLNNPIDQFYALPKVKASCPDEDTTTTTATNTSTAEEDDEDDDCILCWLIPVCLIGVGLIAILILFFLHYNKVTTIPCCKCVKQKDHKTLPAKEEVFVQCSENKSTTNHQTTTQVHGNSPANETTEDKTSKQSPSEISHLLESESSKEREDNQFCDV